ncbi:MAG: hydroxyacylglutathione hydrolase [Paracoccaceae bacterium]
MPLDTPAKAFADSPLEIVTVACLADNYDFLIHDPVSGATAVVDVADPAPIEAELARRGWQLSEIWLTHHHWDHIDGAVPLRAATGAKITGAAADAHRLPALDRVVQPGEAFEFGGSLVDIIDVPGHTIGHIAFHIPSAHALFSADSLMALGCGRLFEGTPEQMFETMQRLAQLPDETVLYSGHEYTASNAKFALTIEPANQALISRSEAILNARAEDQPTVPSLLRDEKATNPYLRAHLDSVKTSLDMADASDLDVFTEIRRRKDNF